MTQQVFRLPQFFPVDVLRDAHSHLFLKAQGQAAPAEPATAEPAPLVTVDEQGRYVTSYPGFGGEPVTIYVTLDETGAVATFEVDASANMGDSSWVDVRLDGSPAQVNSGSYYLFKAFVLSENGKSYVMVRGAKSSKKQKLLVILILVLALAIMAGCGNRNAADDGEESGDDVHEPDDELPEDCRADYEKGCAATRRKRAKH